MHALTARSASRGAAADQTARPKVDPAATGSAGSTRGSERCGDGSERRGALFQRRGCALREIPESYARAAEAPPSSSPSTWARNTSAIWSRTLRKSTMPPLRRALCTRTRTRTILAHIHNAWTQRAEFSQAGKIAAKNGRLGDAVLKTREYSEIRDELRRAAGRLPVDHEVGAARGHHKTGAPSIAKGFEIFTRG